jgi:hypothetical protein
MTDFEFLPGDLHIWGSFLEVRRCAICLGNLYTRFIPREGEFTNSLDERIRLVNEQMEQVDIVPL